MTKILIYKDIVLQYEMTVSTGVVVVFVSTLSVTFPEPNQHKKLPSLDRKRLGSFSFLQYPRFGSICSSWSLCVSIEHSQRL